MFYKPDSKTVLALLSVAKRWDWGKSGYIGCWGRKDCALYVL
jgi:hypothetical protein